MNPQDINRAIAEYCGWEKLQPSATRDMDTNEEIIIGDPPWRRGVFRPLPDYYNDLNAIHEAENKMDLYDQERYPQELCKLLLNIQSRDLQGYYGETNYYNVFTIVNAQSQQRAEAFLRTINKWKN